MNHSQYHEQRLRVAINRRTNAEQGSVNNRIPPEFVSCSEDGMKCTVRYRLKPEMRNPMGWLHGGVTSAMMDAPTTEESNEPPVISPRAIVPLISPFKLSP